MNSCIDILRLNYFLFGHLDFQGRRGEGLESSGVENVEIGYIGVSRNRDLPVHPRLYYMYHPKQGPNDCKKDVYIGF